MNDRNIGEILRFCRERRGMSQGELAPKLLVDRAIVSKVENGHIIPSYVLVKEWATATDSKDIVGLEFTGSADWKKINQMEVVLKQIKSAVEVVQFVRIR